METTQCISRILRPSEVRNHQLYGEWLELTRQLELLRDDKWKVRKYMMDTFFGGEDEFISLHLRCRKLEKKRSRIECKIAYDFGVADHHASRLLENAKRNRRSKIVKEAEQQTQ